MIKRILLSIVLLLVLAYLIVAVTAFNRKPAGQVCRDVELVIKDTVYAGFITKKEVAAMLEKKGVSPIGKHLDTKMDKTKIQHSSSMSTEKMSMAPSADVSIRLPDSSL